MAKDKNAKKDEIKDEAIKDEATVDETASKVAELEKELAAAKEAHIRTLAEYDNYRKRTAKEKEGIYGDAKACCIKEILGVLDNFERALKADSSDLESYKKGVDMIYTNFCENLKNLGVESFGEAGEEFDPDFHNAVMHIEDDEMGENLIAEVFAKGYKIGDRVLRYATVKVVN